MAGELVLDVPLLKAPESLRPARAARPRPQPTGPEAGGRALLETHFDLIQQRLEHLRQRSGLPEHEAEEFHSWALFKLVEDDYRILARWEGRSSFPTYLTVVLVNLMRDYRIHVWGKWRPSAEARRGGREAVLLERLWLRDGLPLDETIARMRAEHGVALSPAELERIAAGLPRRTERRRVGEEELLRVPADGRVEARVEDGERARTAARLREKLLPLFQALPAEDRLLLKLHYRDGHSLAAIAPLLGRPQRELYSRRDRCLKSLRQALEAAGLDASRVSALLDGSLWELQPDLWE
jgi:RNA polymerase sigma factor (sigma-70 family)